MADYQSVWEGKQIDDGIGRIINGELDKLTAQAASSAQYAQAAERGVKDALANIPEGETPIINDLVTGGARMPLSAEMGKKLQAEKAGDLGNLTQAIFDDTTYPHPYFGTVAGLVGQPSTGQYRVIYIPYFSSAEGYAVQIAVGAVSNDWLHWRKAVGCDWQEWHTAATTSMLSNPNLLINWYLADPINRRGQKSYSGNGYCIDMWSLFAGSITLQADGIVITKLTGAEYAAFASPMETAPAGIVTLSALVGGTIYTASGMVGTSIKADYPGGYVDLYTWGGQAQVRIIQIEDVSPVISRIKLEQGAISTLANDPPPDRGTELAKCQRYQINLATKASYQIFGIGRVASATSATISVPLPVTMRLATPALEVDATKFSLNNTIPVLGMTLSNASANAAKINVTVAGGLTVGEACFLTNANNIVPLILNANL